MRIPATLLTACLLLSLIPCTVWPQGLAISGVGPVNAAMAGVATAAPLDAAGALHWNPATISGLRASEVAFGVALVMPSSELSSRIEPGALGNGFPFTTLAGSDRGEPGASPVPHIAYVEKIPDSAWTWGVGVFGIGGFRANYAASVTNPILTPPPPNGVGVGRVFSEVEVLQIAPTLSCALSDRLSVGFAPTVTLAKITAEPLLLAAPDDANGDSFASYPSGRGNRTTWGGGFQLGVYYIAGNKWHLGAAVKSPQWFEPFRFKTEDELGRPRSVNANFEYPLIITVGTAYAGFENLVIACDVRYFDYENADGFRQAGLAPSGAVQGLGWNSIMAVSAGAQYRLSDAFFLRLGYSYNQNPISDDLSSLNVASPVITQHFAYCGFSRQVTCRSIFSVAYIHGFENEISGPIQTPVGPLGGTAVTSQTSLDSLVTGITIRF